MDANQDTTRDATHDATQDAAHDQDYAEAHASTPPVTPLSPIEARRAEDEARQQAASTGAELFGSQHRGKAEAEMRRLSEEVTRAARARLLAAQAKLASSKSGEPHAEPNERDTDVPATRLPPPIPFKHVAVALDGSDFAERALPYATAVARMTDARLVLAHVEPMSGALDTMISSSESDQARAEGIRPYLDALLRQQVPLQRQRVYVAISPSSSPARGLIALQEEGLADLVVMTTRARQGVQRLLLGSVADEVLRSGRAPMLIVSPRVAPPPEGTLVFSHAVVPLDGSPLSEQAFGALGGLVAPASNAPRTLRTVTLLTVVEHPALVPDGEAYLDAMRQQMEVRLPVPELTIRTATLVGDAATLIAGIVPGAAPDSASGSAPREDAPTTPALTADLVVMATHGRGGVGRWLLGSVASSILPRIAVPVLLVHPLAAA